MGLPYGEETMIVGQTMWTQSTSVTDARTDRITMTKTAQRIASRGENFAGTPKQGSRKNRVSLSDYIWWLLRGQASQYNRYGHRRYRNYSTGDVF